MAWIENCGSPSCQTSWRYWVTARRGSSARASSGASASAASDSRTARFNARSTAGSGASSGRDPEEGGATRMVTGTTPAVKPAFTENVNQNDRTTGSGTLRATVHRGRDPRIAPVTSDESRPSVERVRADLRQLGYLNTGLDRFVLGHAGGGSALSASLDVAWRLGLLGGVVFGLTLTLAAALLEPRLRTSPQDLVILAGYLVLALGAVTG